MYRHLTDWLTAAGPIGILILSILDSSGIPVAGAFDALLILVAIRTPGVAWLCAGVGVIGSTIGCVILFRAAHHGGRRFMEKAAPEGRAARFRTWFRRYGMVTVFVPALVPIPMPMKLFVISAGIMGTPLVQFVAVVVVARAIRYFGEAWLGVRLGEESTAFLKHHAWHFVEGALVLFLLLYGYIRWQDWRREQSSTQL